MRALIAAALLALALPVAAQTTPAQLTAYVKQLANVVIAQDAKIKALEAAQAKSEQDIRSLVVSHNVNVQYFLVRACDYNSKVAGWKGVLTGLEPIPLNGLTCPPEGTRFYVPYFHGTPPVPPAP